MAKMVFRAPPPTPAEPSPRRRRLGRVSQHGQINSDSRDSGAWFESTWMLRDGLEVEELPAGSHEALPGSEHVRRKVRKP